MEAHMDKVDRDTVGSGKRHKGKTVEDETLYCENCGISFIWTMEEQLGLKQLVQLPDLTPTLTSTVVDDEADRLGPEQDQDAPMEGQDLSDSAAYHLANDNVNDIIDNDIIDNRVTDDSDIDDDIEGSYIEDVTTADTANEPTRPPLHCPGCRELLPPSAMERGLVRWYHRRKGYGFITRYNAPDLHMHRSGFHRSVRRSLPEPGDLVEFTVANTRRGQTAAKLKVLQKAKSE